MNPDPSALAAQRGEPSYVWRAGQQRRLEMILAAAPMTRGGRVLVDGCGVGMYVHHLAAHAQIVYGLDIEFERLAAPVAPSQRLVCAAAEGLPYPDNMFDVVLSHEVLEHVADDRAALREIVRVLRVGARAVIFVPNRWYPFETHGIYWRGAYLFGNKPFVNYLPQPLRDRLAPHVRVYTRRSLHALLAGLHVRVVSHHIIYGGYDNIIARFGGLGRALRQALYLAERTPLHWWGLSHFLVLEKLSA